ncbi:MAG: RNA pseudouridine synthase [Eubacteriales bacterium]|nr:RNA pseudouridine synthase [Eubacteriales bacterium]MDD4541010.1 RNA pseudouridine synthase [Eubacteriales bacterium]
MPKIQLLYEDNHLLIVVKPAGILSQGDSSQDADILSHLKEYIRVNENKPGEAYLGLVQRLDRPVSGLMVFAKTSKAASRLSDQIRRRSLKRDYIALCHGMPDSESGVFIDYLTRKPLEGKVRLARESDGVRAELSYRVLQRNYELDRSLLLIRLDTGRRHQIRVQLALRGLPILGDYRYSDMTPADKELYSPALHAAGLGLMHPTKKEEMYFFSSPSCNNSFASVSAEEMEQALNLASELGLIPKKADLRQEIIKEI